MAGDAHGAETQEEPQVHEDLGREQAQEERPQVSGVDWEKAIAERDEKVAALEQQVADAARSAEAAEALRGKTGLPNAGTSTDSGKTLKRWRKLAGLDDSDENYGHLRARET